MFASCHCRAKKDHRRVVLGRGRYEHHVLREASTRTRCDRKNDEVFVIRPDSYEGTEYVCRYVKVTADSTSTQTDSKCDGEGWEWTEHATISFSKNRLVVRVRQTSPERR